MSSLKETAIKLVRKILNKAGYSVFRARPDGLPIDFSDEDAGLVSRVREYTMTREGRIVALKRAVQYVCLRNLPGDFVEAGVWKGGSSMVAAIEFLNQGATKELFLFDSYDLPIPAPLDIDRDLDGTKIFGGASTEQPYWNCVTAEQVSDHLATTGYPMEKVHLIKGLVTDTIPDQAPEKICILRLDTDTYESTKYEMEKLYPRLVDGGVLVLDDYGTHGGVRKAVDDYFEGSGDRPLITRVDTAGAIAIKV